METLIGKVIDLIKSSSVEAVVRWGAVLHNFIAPGYLYLFMFRERVFINLGTFKLVVLSIVLSVPIAYVFYLVAGNIIKKQLASSGVDIQSLRIAVLLWWSAAIVLIDIIIFIWGSINA